MSTKGERLAAAVLEAIAAAELPITVAEALRLRDALLERLPGKSIADRAPWQPWTPHQVETLIRLRAEGAKPREIQRALGKTAGQVNGALSRLAAGQEIGGPIRGRPRAVS